MRNAEKRKKMGIEKLLEGDFWLGVAATCLGWMAQFVAPIDQFLWLVAGLILCDFVTGIIAAKRRGEQIVASKMKKTVSKLIVYMVGFLAAGGIEYVYDAPAPYLISVPIVLTEFKSNIENIEEVSGTKIWANIKELIPIIKKRLK